MNYNLSEIVMLVPAELKRNLNALLKTLSKSADPKSAKGMAGSESLQQLLNLMNFLHKGTVRMNVSNAAVADSALDSRKKEKSPDEIEKEQFSEDFSKFSPEKLDEINDFGMVLTRVENFVSSSIVQILCSDQEIVEPADAIIKYSKGKADYQSEILIFLNAALLLNKLDIYIRDSDKSKSFKILGPIIIDLSTQLLQFISPENIAKYKIPRVIKNNILEKTQSGLSYMMSKKEFGVKDSDIKAVLELRDKVIINGAKELEQLCFLMLSSIAEYELSTKKTTNSVVNAGDDSKIEIFKRILKQYSAKLESEEYKKFNQYQKFILCNKFLQYVVFPALQTIAELEITKANKTADFLAEFFGESSVYIKLCQEIKEAIKRFESLYGFTQTCNDIEQLCQYYAVQMGFKDNNKNFVDSNVLCLITYLGFDKLAAKIAKRLEEIPLNEEIPQFKIEFARIWHEFSQNLQSNKVDIQDMVAKIEPMRTKYQESAQKELEEQQKAVKEKQEELERQRLNKVSNLEQNVVQAANQAKDLIEQETAEQVRVRLLEEAQQQRNLAEQKKQEEEIQKKLDERSQKEKDKDAARAQARAADHTYGLSAQEVASQGNSRYEPESAARIFLDKVRAPIDLNIFLTKDHIFSGHKKTKEGKYTLSTKNIKIFNADKAQDYFGDLDNEASQIKEKLPAIEAALFSEDYHYAVYQQISKLLEGLSKNENKNISHLVRVNYAKNIIEYAEKYYELCRSGIEDKQLYFVPKMLAELKQIKDQIESLQKEIIHKARISYGIEFKKSQAAKEAAKAAREAKAQVAKAAVGEDLTDAKNPDVNPQDQIPKTRHIKTEELVFFNSELAELEQKVGVRRGDRVDLRGEVVKEYNGAGLTQDSPPLLQQGQPAASASAGFMLQSQSASYPDSPSSTLFTRGKVVIGGNVVYEVDEGLGGGLVFTAVGNINQTRG